MALSQRLVAVGFVDDEMVDDAEADAEADVAAGNVGVLLLGLAGPFGVPAIAKPAVGDGCPPSVPCTARQRRNIVRPMTNLTKLMVRPFGWRRAPRTKTRVERVATPSMLDMTVRVNRIVTTMDGAAWGMV